VDKLSLPKFLEEVKVVAKESKLKKEALERTAYLTSVAAKIGNGHAYSEHIHEFSNLGVTTKEQLVNHVSNILTNKNTKVRALTNGRSAFLDDKTMTVIILDPKSPDSGTIFIPKNPVTNELDAINYFYNVLN
jgi:hypothetical protein